MKFIRLVKTFFDFFRQVQRSMVHDLLIKNATLPQMKPLFYGIIDD